MFNSSKNCSTFLVSVLLSLPIVNMVHHHQTTAVHANTVPPITNQVSILNQSSNQQTIKPTTKTSGL